VYVVIDKRGIVREHELRDFEKIAGLIEQLLAAQ